MFYSPLTTYEMKYYVDLKYRLKEKLQELPYNDYYWAV